MINTFYILKPGKLNIEDGSILFTDYEEEKVIIPIKQVKDLYLLVDINPTSNILKLIMDEGIIIHYFNLYEYYLGSLIPKNHKNSGKIIVKEVLAYHNLEERLKIAKEIMYGCFKNINNVIKYYERKKILNNKLNINKYINKLKHSNNINQLMLLEAEFRKNYYSYFPDILKLENFSRVMRGAEDIVNVLINFINSLLYSIIFSEIKKTNISGMIGFIHEVDHDRYPLIYDISELFKPIIVDRLIFTLINKGQISDKDLIEGKLNDKTVKMIFREWDNKINKTFYYKPLKRYVSYRYLIREEIYKIERCLTKGTKYNSFRKWW